MTIYIDVVLLENLVMNYIILYATSIILRIKAKSLRLFLGSLIGAIYSVISYISVLQIYSTILLKIVLSIVIVYVAFYPQYLKSLLKQLLIFYLTSFVFGGAAFSLIYFLRPQDILMRNGLFLGTYPLKVILVSGIVAYFIIIIAFKFIKTKISKKDIFCEITVELNEKKIQTKAILDTGNLLRDPISNLPVVVIERNILYNVISKEILNNLENILGGDWNEIPEKIQKEYILKLKVIPFRSLGKQNGMLLGIKASKVEIKIDDEIIAKDEVIIGIYNHSLTKRGEYQALLGIDMI